MYNMLIKPQLQIVEAKQVSLASFQVHPRASPADCLQHTAPRSKTGGRLRCRNVANIDNQKNFLVDQSKSFPSLQYKLQNSKVYITTSFYWTVINVYACVN